MTRITEMPFIRCSENVNQYKHKRAYWMTLTPANEVKTVTVYSLDETPLPAQSTHGGTADRGGGLGERASSAPPAPHLAWLKRGQFLIYGAIEMGEVSWCQRH